MPISVPSADEFAALTARVAALEAAVFKPPVGPTPTFHDDFRALSLANIYSGSADGTWMPVSWWGPQNTGYAGGDGWYTNPFNPATPLPTLYRTDGTAAAPLGLQLGLQHTPPNYLAACGGKPYVTGQIVSEFRQRGGYFEATLKVPHLIGTNFAWWLMRDGSPYGEIDIAEIVTTQDGKQFWKISVWDTTQKIVSEAYSWDFAPGYDPQQMHAYGLDWDVARGQLTFFLDRRPVFQCPVPSGYDVPMMMILSSQTGGDWTGPIPAGATLGPMTVGDVTVWKDRPF